MSIYEKSQSAAIAEFRTITEAISMCGVASPTFMCRKCRIPKTITGRKRVSQAFPRDGYICADCAGGKAQ